MSNFIFLFPLFYIPATVLYITRLFPQLSMNTRSQNWPREGGCEMFCNFSILYLNLARSISPLGFLISQFYADARNNYFLPFSNALKSPAHRVPQQLSFHPLFAK